MLLNEWYEDKMMTGRSSRSCMYELNGNTATARDFHNWVITVGRDKHEYNLTEEYVVNVRT